MWVGVIRRFGDFRRNLQLSDDEIERGHSRYNNITRALNRAYYDGGDGNSEWGGSWRKRDAISPSADIDMYFHVPIEIFRRFESYQGNGQSALLNEVRNKLLVTYSQTQIRGDGQVIVIGFNDQPTIEVVPCCLSADGHLIIPNSNDGGSWIRTNPDAESRAIDYVDSDCNKNARPLIQMVKQWARHCNVPLKSFYIELLVCQFLPHCRWKQQSLYFYDWIVRDFFEFLVQQSNSFVIVPGTYEVISLGDAWVSRAETAHGRALKACEFEYIDDVISAGLEWQKIFGNKVPL